MAHSDLTFRLFVSSIPPVRDGAGPFSEGGVFARHSRCLPIVPHSITQQGAGVVHHPFSQVAKENRTLKEKEKIMNQINKMRSFAMIVTVACASGPWAIVASGASQAVVIRKGDGQTIQRAIDRLPAAGGQVVLQPGAYVCLKSIVIDRDNVELRGSGPATVLRLADGANAPVLVLGNTNAVPTITRTNIHVVGLTIDGNRVHQSSELNPANSALRNNGISMRRVESCTVERVTVFSCRSGGLVAELGCRRITVRDFESYDNHFDGLAAYETENSHFTALKLHDNLAAGLSFDIRFNNNLLSDTIIVSNKSVGIFMRDARDNAFQGLQIRSSGDHGVFLAQVDADPTKPAAGNTFIGFVVSDSAGAGFRVNDTSCVSNLVVGSQFINNSNGCISEAVSDLLQSSGTICR